MLSTASIFADLTESDREIVRSRCRQVQVLKRDVVVSEGAVGDDMFIIDRGRLRMSALSEDGKEIGFGILVPGDTFGEMAMLDGEPRSATVTAIEPCTLQALSRGAFQALIVDHPSLAINLMVILSQRLRHTSRLYRDSAFMQVPGRLAQFLLQFSKPREAGAAPSMTISLSQYELGTLVNASRESVNKLLKAWEEAGAIEQDRGHIRILRPRFLIEQCAEGRPERHL